MQVVKKEADALHMTLELTLEPADYATTFEQELKKYKNQVQMRGFRKGMAPMSVIKKMVGKSILSEVINNTLQDRLFGYLDENKINYIGQPLPNRDENLVFQFDVQQLKPYTFSFDLGLTPEFEVQGVSATDRYDWYDVTIPGSLVDEELQAARRRFGKHIQAEDTIQKMDLIRLDAAEIQDGHLVEGGWKTEFTLLVDSVTDEKTQQEILTKKVNDSLEFDIYALEGKSDEHVRKYLLKIPEDSDVEPGRFFRATITEVSRVEPADLNEEFFSTFGDESIQDEETLRAFLHNDLKAYYDKQSSQFMFRQVMDVLMEKNEVPLPEAFLKRYLLETNENLTEELLENEFAAFAKNMRWSLQKTNLAKRYEIEVTEEDLRRHFMNAVFSYMRNYGQMDYSFITTTVDRLMKDKDQVNKAYEEILADRIFDNIESTIQKNPIPVSQEDFVQKVKELNERLNNL